MRKKDIGAIKILIREIHNNGEIVTLKGKRYSLPRTPKRIEGKLSVTQKGFGFVITNDDNEDNKEIENNVNFFVGEIDLDPKSIKELCFTISDQIDNLFMILLSKSTDKVFMSCFISKNLIEEKELDASKIIRELTPLINGSGGGQSFYATGGGTNINGIDSVIKESKKIISQI